MSDAVGVGWLKSKLSSKEVSECDYCVIGGRAVRNGRSTPTTDPTDCE